MGCGLDDFNMDSDPEVFGIKEDQPDYSAEWAKLTPPMQSNLAWGLSLERRFDCGIGPRFGGSFAMFDKLVKMGYVRFQGWGPDIDGGGDKEYLVYRLTPKAKALLTAMGED